MSRPTDLRPKNWVICDPMSPQQEREFDGVSPILAQILFNRGLRTKQDAHVFLQRQYNASTDPFLLPDMDKAVARIQKAMEEQQQIAIYGDFDADGVTSTVLLTKALRMFGIDHNLVRPYIPDRVDEGYGLNKDALTKLREKFGVDLVITVDCGIRSTDEVAHANEIGLDIIITDHHSVPDVLPDAVAIINPQRSDSDYPERKLAGVGVAFKLVEALALSLPDHTPKDLTQLLDLVAIGTVADLMPLLGENRHLVANGLEVLNQAKRPGISSLLSVAGIKPGHATAESIAFGIAPRINAAGRLEHAMDAAKTLAAPDLFHGQQYAQKLDQLNRRRQELTAQSCELVESLISPDDPIIVAGHSSFEQGVVGLVAGRLTEKYHRPSIILQMGDEVSHASCRSVEGFNITKTLDSVSHFLERYGGHAMAAGLTIRNEHITAFKEAILAIGREVTLLQPMDAPSLYIDMEIELDEIDFALYELLKQLEPTGQKNPPPVFMASGVKLLQAKAVGRDSSHLQLVVTQGDRNFSCIAFRQGAWVGTMPDMIDIVYTIGINEFRGQTNLQLQVVDIQPTNQGEQGRTTA